MTCDDSATRIFLARHGEAAYPSTTEGRTSGGVLTDLGQDQARGLGHRLRDQSVAAVVCSVLSRAQQTADIAANLLGVEVHRQRGLHEYGLGEQPYDEQTLGMTLLGWLAGDLQARVPGGESGEEIVQRVFPVLDDLARRHAGMTVLVVMHGGAIIATLGRIAPGRTGLPSDNNPSNLVSDIPGGAFFCIEHRRDSWRIIPPADLP